MADIEKISWKFRQKLKPRQQKLTIEAQMRNKSKQKESIDNFEFKWKILKDRVLKNCCLVIVSKRFQDTNFYTFSSFCKSFAELIRNSVLANESHFPPPPIPIVKRVFSWIFQDLIKIFWPDFDPYFSREDGKGIENIFLTNYRLRMLAKNYSEKPSWCFVPSKMKKYITFSFK